MLFKALTVSAFLSVAAAGDSSCAAAYNQCGGLNWAGATCCETGFSCVVQNDYYSQCLEDADNSGCQPFYQQCGGKEFTGTTCCKTGSTCQVVNEYYHQCLPGTGHSHADTASTSTQAVDNGSQQSTPQSSSAAAVVAAPEASSSVAESPKASAAAPVVSSAAPVVSSAAPASVESPKASSSPVVSTVSSAAPAASSKAAVSENQFSFTSIAGGKSGTGKTTRYWDCCKPSCSWNGKADVSSPVAACNADGKTISDVNAQSGCVGGTSYMCSNQQPFAVNSTLAFGFVAASMIGYGESQMCCTCVLMTFNDGPAAGKQMVAQVTNTGTDLSSNHFDIAMPGGGFGIFANGCPTQWNSPASNWGQTYGGVSSAADCKNLPTELQAGCDWRFDFLDNSDNPSVSFVEIECPSQITDITGCKRN
ncbi:hypothetical protein D0Z00_004281 [Geotrichum galactomycetum]|uniref:Uncharacterized protein n=1 Tax=Geotrichum galactomycetum TaxID=27317 RepID=A0ACB6UYT4_9ASCO|nr:hypothetical protein D0Z00_004281 [Geotrichum candidum]